MKGWLALTALALTLLLAGVAVADEAVPFSWTYEAGAVSVPPAWLKIASPVNAGTTLGELDFDLAPPLPSSDLLVTLTFTEAPDGFLRILWTPAQGQAVMLTPNFQEGTAMPNRRGLLIPAELIGTGGRLTLQSSSVDPKVARIEWDWLTPRAIPVAQGPGAAWQIIDASGRGRLAVELSGDPELPAPDRWKRNIITAVLTDKPARSEVPVRFAAELTQAPGAARLDVELAGLPLDVPVRLWINGKLAGFLAVQVPDLNDPAYRSGAGADGFVGWREGSAWIPVALLAAGTNTIQFDPLWSDSTASPLAVKRLRLQLDYGPTPTQPATTPAP